MNASNGVPFYVVHALCTPFIFGCHWQTFGFAEAMCSTYSGNRWACGVQLLVRRSIIKKFTSLVVMFAEAMCGGVWRSIMKKFVHNQWSLLQRQCPVVGPVECSGVWRSTIKKFYMTGSHFCGDNVHWLVQWSAVGSGRVPQFFFTLSVVMFAEAMCSVRVKLVCSGGVKLLSEIGLVWQSKIAE